jgi:hypothetical protein
MKIFHVILLVAFSLYGQTDDVLIIRPDVSDFKKVELGIHGAIRNKVTMNPVSSGSATDIINTITAGSTKLVVVMGNKEIRRWRKLQQKHQEIHQIPSILLDNDFYNDNMPNSCIINFEPKLRHYIDNVVQMTGKKPQDIGVVYSSNSREIVTSYQRDASHLNVNLHAEAVVISDPENSIKSIVKNLTRHSHIDFMIIVNDHAVINNRNVASTWLSLLSPLRIPVAVPSDYFYELEPRIGSFAIKPHYREIGRVVASVINSAQANNWKLIQKRIYTDKSIFYLRNDDGSISKQNQLRSDIIASLHPKIKEATPGIKPVRSETAPKQQSELSYNVTAPKPKPSATSNKSPASAGFGNELQKIHTGNTNTPASTPAEKTGSPGPGKDIRKSIQHVARTSNEVADKKIPAIKKNIPEKSTVQPVALAGADSFENRSLFAEESGRRRYDIEVTAMTAKVFRALAPEFPVLGMVKSGDKLEVFDEDSFWYSVAFMGDTGFLSKADARIVPEEKTFALFPGVNYQWIIITAVCLLTAVLILSVLLAIRMIRHSRTIRYNCLLIAKKSKKIKYSKLYNKNVCLNNYLKNHGFRVRKVNDIDKKGVASLFCLPDLICVDWQFGINIQDEVYNLLKEGMCTSNFILIFYNIPAVSEIKKNSYYDDRTFFFDTLFTVSDMSKILSVFLSDSHTSQLTDQTKSCLEGKISGDTLSEIFQMMDMGKKTGCLLVEDQHPVGMLFFEDGTITYAITSTQITQQAVFEILSTRHGRFKFLPGKKPVKKQMQLNTLAVLMEKAQIIDESAPATSGELVSNSSVMEATIFESELESDNIEK